MRLLLSFLIVTAGIIAPVPHVWQASAVAAQDKRCPIPEFNDKPAFCGQTSDSLVELEKSQYQPMTKKGWVANEAGYHLGGATSNVRIKSSNDLEFVIKVTPGTDPTSVVELFVFTIDNGERIFMTTKRSIFSGSKATVEKIPYQVKKIADGVYALSATTLKPGEYFFGGANSMFAFGVDE